MGGVRGLRELVEQRAGLGRIKATRESDALQVRDRRAWHRRIGSPSFCMMFTGMFEFSILSGTSKIDEQSLIDTT